MSEWIDADCRAWREIDLDAVAHNARELQRSLGPGCRLMAVVKADAYGHGAAEVSRRLEREGVSAFAVACLSEGVQLRRSGVKGRILILGYTPPEQAGLAARWRLIPAAVDEEHAAALSAQGVPLPVHLALDTGMHRLGVPAGDHGAIRRIYALPNLDIRGTFSHLCVSDSPLPDDRAYTRCQLELFYDTLRWMKENGCPPGQAHIQASYGIWNLPHQPCAWARAGVALYGVGSDDTPTENKLDLRPVLSLRARVASVRTLQAGQGAGYSLAFRTERACRLASVTIGYADGIPRAWPGQGGQVLISGQWCSMVGRACMDQLLVDVTSIPGVRAGDVVTLIGRDGEERITAEEAALQCGTITNELLSRLGARLPMLFREGGVLRPGLEKGSAAEFRSGCAPA